MSSKYRRIACSFAGAFGCAALLALPLGAAQAQDQTPYVMKISTPTIHDIPDTYARNFGAALEKDSGGRIKVEVYPASQLGSIPRQIEGTQFGAIQCEVVPPEFMSRPRRALRDSGCAGPGRFAAPRSAPRRRSGGARSDAFAWRRKGSARRRPVHGRAVRRRDQETRSAISRTSRARSFGFSPRRSKAWRFSGSA